LDIGDPAAIVRVKRFPKTNAVDTSSPPREAGKIRGVLSNHLAWQAVCSLVSARADVVFCDGRLAQRLARLLYTQYLTFFPYSPISSQVDYHSYFQHITDIYDFSMNSIGLI
jgi:hypothetical protein